MKIKTINKIIKKKVDDWIASIDDEALRRRLEKDVIITGGCITSFLQGEKVNDFDIYFTNFETTKKVAEYYIEKANSKYNCGATLDWDEVGLAAKRVRIHIPSKGIAGEVQTEENDYIETDAPTKDEKKKEPYSVIHISENAITLSDMIQLVVRFYGDADEIHKNYDFIHCTNYWTRQTELVTNTAALESILTKELQYSGSLYPLCSIIRTRKFIGRGWRIHAGQYLKMCFQLNVLDLQNIEVLRDQLTGVDSAFFHMLIEAMESKKEADPDFKMSPDYVCEIVDRIFN